MRAPSRIPLLDHLVVDASSNSLDESWMSSGRHQTRYQDVHLPQLFSATQRRDPSTFAFTALPAAATGVTVRPLPSTTKATRGTRLPYNLLVRRVHTHCASHPSRRLSFTCAGVAPCVARPHTQLRATDLPGHPLRLASACRSRPRRRHGSEHPFHGSWRG